MKQVEIKGNLHKIIDNIEDNNLLDAVYAFLLKLTERQEKTDFWEGLTDEQKSVIDAGIAQLDAGQGIPHEEVMKRIRNKFKIV